MKPRIFLGSSKEGLVVAEYVKAQLEIDFDCFLWTDEIFKYNESAFDTLLKEAGIFDFGILVATKDDFSKIRDVYFDVPRDNIVFEFGLFLGRLGPSKSFIIQQEGTHLPTDLLGITVPRFTLADPINKSASLNQEIERIRKTIKEKVELGELGLLPSTVLAIGYFTNLVQLICDELLGSPGIEVDGIMFRQFEFNIVIPSDLDADIKKRATYYYRSKNFKEIRVESKGRSFPVFVNYDSSQKNLLSLYDMPTTLVAIDKAIEMYMRKGHIGKTNQQKLLEVRELSNFQTTLQNLIDNDSFAKTIVKVISE